MRAESGQAQAIGHLVIVLSDNYLTQSIFDTKEEKNGYTYTILGQEMFCTVYVTHYI